MTTSDRLEQRTSELLVELAAPAYPDYFNDVLELAIDRPQRPAWTFPERWLPMGVTTRQSALPVSRWVLAAAVVAVAVALGAAFFFRNNDQTGVGVTPSASPSAGPSESVQPPATSAPVRTLSNAPVERCPGNSPVECIEPGTYTLGPGWADTISFTVPAGWYSPDPAPGIEALLVDRSPDAPASSGWGVWFLMVDTASVSRDPCDPDAGLYPSADVETADELAAAMTNWPGFDVTPPEAITVDGISGIRVRVTSTKGAEECPASLLLLTTNGAQRTQFPAYPMINDTGDPYPADFRIFEINGTLIAIRTMGLVQTSPNEESIGIARDPDRHAEDQVELTSILDSIQISPFPQAQP
jgi:hypothetical protein